MKNLGAKIELIAGSVIFGTIGVLRKITPMASGTLSIFRGIIGSLILLLIMLFKKQKIDFKAIRANLPILVLSGVSIGINWILIFEAMNLTSVAIASLCYYTAPVFIILGSALAYKEKITVKNTVCMFLALFGMTLVSGVWTDTLSADQTLGVVLSVAAAIFYATGIVLNKKLSNIDALDKTIVQLLSAAFIVIPYSLFFEKQIPFDPSVKNILFVAIMGVFHTGIAFAFTFDSVSKLDTKTVAFFTYIDPVVAVVTSGLILKEGITGLMIVGAVFIIGSAVYNELKSN